jgi:hypothetical protein
VPGRDVSPQTGPMEALFALRKERATRVFAVAFALAVVGCPSSTPPIAQGSATYCMALSTFPGAVVVTLGATSTQSGLRFTIQSAANAYPSLSVFAALPGTSLEALVYDASNGSGATTLVYEAPTGGILWVQASAQDGDVGTFSLSVSDAGPAVPIDGGMSWPSPQAVFSAALLPVGTLTDAGLDVAVTTGAPCACGTVCT